MILLKSTTQDELNTMNIQLESEKLLSGYTPIHYSPNAVQNNIFRNTSKEAQNSIHQSVNKNQKTHAINNIQSQMIASKIPLCLVQDIYGKLHQLVYMIPQNLYEQFSTNIQTGKKVTLRSHYETLQSQRNINSNESKESYSCSVNIKDHLSKQPCLITEQTNKDNVRVQQHEDLKQQQVLLQLQNHHQQMLHYQVMQLEYQKQQQELQSQHQMQQVHDQQQLQMQYRQQSPQNLLLSFGSQNIAHLNTQTLQKTINIQELQISPNKKNPKHQDQKLETSKHQEILPSPPLQQIRTKEDIYNDNEIDFFAEFKNNFNKNTPGSQTVFSKSSDIIQSITLPAADKLDFNIIPDKSDPLVLNSNKADRTNEQLVCNVDLQINSVNLRKRKNSTISDFENEIKKSNLVVDSPKCDFNEMFNKISPTSNDTSVSSSDTSTSDESQDLIWNLFWDEISSTSNDSESFISEDFNFFDNDKHKMLDESLNTDLKDPKDYCIGSRDDYCIGSRDDYSKIRSDQIDHFDLFQHILM